MKNPSQRAIELLKPKGHWTCSCGFTSIDLRNAILHMHEYPQSPNLTTAKHGDIPLIVSWMIRLGIWDSFLDWHLEQIHGYDTAGTYAVIHYAEYDILIDGTHRLEAIKGFLEGRKK